MLVLFRGVERSVLGQRLLDLLRAQLRILYDDAITVVAEVVEAVWAFGFLERCADFPVGWLSGFFGL